MYGCEHIKVLLDIKYSSWEDTRTIVGSVRRKTDSYIDWVKKFCSNISVFFNQLVGSSVLNSNTFSFGFLMKNRNLTKYFWRCVVDANDHPPMKLQCHISIHLGYLKAQTRHLGGGH